MDFYEGKDYSQTPILGFSAKPPPTEKKVFLPQYTWPVALGVLFLVAWGVLFIAGVFGGASSSASLQPCMWDPDVKACRLNPEPLGMVLEKSGLPQASVVLESMVCQQQDDEIACKARDSCAWIDAGNACLFEKYAACILPDYNVDPDPSCSSMAAFARAMHNCAQYPSRGSCKEDSDCEWNELKGTCAVTEAYFVNIIFGNSEGSLREAVLQIEDVCKIQEDAPSCTAVVAPAEMDALDTKSTNKSDHKLEPKPDASLFHPRIFIRDS